MRNLKKLWFLIKVLGASICTLVILAAFITYFPKLFFTVATVLFLISIWVISDDLID